MFQILIELLYNVSHIFAIYFVKCRRNTIFGSWNGLDDKIVGTDTVDILKERIDNTNKHIRKNYKDNSNCNSQFIISEHLKTYSTLWLE